MTTAAVSIGSGYKGFLFEVGALGMLHVEVRADSREEALAYIISGDCLEDFPAHLREEITGEIFTLVEETD